MSLDLAFNPPQFDDNEYSGIKMRQFVEEVERLHAVLTNNTTDEGVEFDVTSWNGRVGDIVPIEGDYDLELLGDVSIIGDSKYDMLFNATGTEYQATKGELIWNHDLDFLQLANAHSINWLNTSGVSVELAILTADVLPQPIWTNVQYLANFDGADEQITYTTVDQNAYVLGNTGTKLDSAQAKFGATSAYFDGNNDAWTANENGSISDAMLNTDWCCEGWMYHETGTFARGGHLLCGAWAAAANKRQFNIAIIPSGEIQFEWSTDGTSGNQMQVVSTGANVGTISTWHHIAVTYNEASQLLRMFANGVKVYEATSDGVVVDSLGNSGADFVVGRIIAFPQNDYPHKGWLDDVRVTVGETVYTDSFTPPASAHPVGTGGIAQSFSEFNLGDPGYPTEIDGTLIGLKNNIGVNWDNVLGDDVELLIFTGGVQTDPLIDEVILLLHFDEVNGSRSYRDSSVYRNHGKPSGTNNAVQAPLSFIKTDQSKFGGSSFFSEDNFGSHVKIPYSSEQNLGQNDWTMEWFQRNNTITQTEALMCTLESSNGTWCIFQYADNGGEVAMSIRDGTGTVDFGPVRWPAGATVGAWHHKAFVRDGDLIRYFVDGVEQTPNSSAALPTNYVFAVDNNPIRIGDYNLDTSTAFTFDGYIDEVRITNGTARYTADFTPPSVPFDTAIVAEGDPYLSSVTFQSDCEGADAATSLANQGTGVDPIFVGAAALDTDWSVSGVSSIKIDGTNDGVVVLDSGNDGIDNLGTADFTIEMWVFDKGGVGEFVAGRWVDSAPAKASWALVRSSATDITAQISDGTTVYTNPTNATNTDKWVHLAIVRDGDTLYYYRDGVDQGSWSGTPSAGFSVPYNTADAKTVLGGRWDFGTSDYGAEWTGWIDQVRITPGIARYPGGTTFIPNPIGVTTTAFTAIDAFVVGDPSYGTQIDGQTTNITSAATDIDGTLNVDGTSTLNADVTLLGAGTELRLPFEDDAVTPTLAFGAVDYGTGFYLHIEDASGDVLGVAMDGVYSWGIFQNNIQGTLGGGGPRIDNEAPSATNPVFLPSRVDVDTGIGQNAADQISMICAATEIGRWTTSGLAVTGALTATSHGGIIEANLLDKTATETISGAWNWSTANLNLDNNIYITGDDSVATPRTILGVANTNIFYVGNNNLATTLRGSTVTVDNATTINADTTLNGATVNLAPTGNVNVTAGGNFQILSGAGFRIYDSGNTDYMDLSHDGTDFTTTFVNTTDWNITGLAGNNIIFQNNLRLNWRNSSALDDGTELYRATGNALRLHYAANALVLQAINDNSISIRDSSDTATITMYPVDGSIDFKEGNIWNSGGLANDFLRFRDTTDGVDLVFHYDGVDWGLFSEPSGAANQYVEFDDSTGAVSLFHGNNKRLVTAGSQVTVRGNASGDNQIRYIQLADSAGTAYMQVGQLGASESSYVRCKQVSGLMRIETTNSASAIRLGYFQDPDANTIVRGATDVELEVANGENALVARANAEVELYYNNVEKFTTKSNGVGVTGGVFIDERAAAPTSEATRGILWVKNTTPAQLWFTDDAGTDTQIV